MPRTLFDFVFERTNITARKRSRHESTRPDQLDSLICTGILSGGSFCRVVSYGCNMLAFRLAQATASRTYDGARRRLLKGGFGAGESGVEVGLLIAGFSLRRDPRFQILHESTRGGTSRFEMMYNAGESHQSAKTGIAESGDKITLARTEQAWSREVVQNYSGRVGRMWSVAKKSD